MKELIDSIKQEFETRTEIIEKPIFTKKGFNGLEIKKDRFTLLDKISSNNKKITFIDGGNAELISGNNINVQILRIGAVTYKGKEKVSKEVKDFYVHVIFKDNKFIAKILPDNRFFEFDMNDEALRSGKSFAGISVIGGFIRRLAELELAIKMLKKSDVIVIDGSLEVKFDLEKEVIESLYSKAENESKIICSLCKTNSIITSSGKSLSSVISNLKNNKSSWFFYPIAKIQSDDFKADIAFVKLNNNSKHIFKLDLHNASKEKFKEVCSEISKTSNDAVFPGYPYGLIEVDRLARVSNNDKEYLRTKLMVELKDKWKIIELFEKDKDAHSILDSVG